MSVSDCIILAALISGGTLAFGLVIYELVILYRMARGRKRME